VSASKAGDAKLDDLGAVGMIEFEGVGGVVVLPINSVEDGILVSE
jgi:hypothetical protein